MAAPRFAGVIPILATPFHDDESLDLASLDRMVRFFGELGVDGFTVLGVLGEANRLTDAERAAVVRAAVAAAGGRPVIVGTSHAGTAATIALGREAATLGAAAVMVAPTKLPTPSEAVVFEYYRRVAEASPLPVVVQDHPLSTEVHLGVPLLLRLANELPAVACLKAEALPSPARIAAFKAGLRRPEVSVLTGLGGLYGLFDLERGSDGFNTGFAFPEVLQAIVARMRAGDTDGARRVYARHLPLLVFEQQPGVAIRKEILRRRGLLASARVRHPGADLDAGTAAQLDRLLAATFPGQDLTRPLSVGD
jgi:4-hydroxy-tetrahydrodipicolinate synthase